MILIPFFIQRSPPSLISWKLQPITLFLENRGKQFCDIENPEHWLQENGFFIKEQWKEGNVMFVEIDTEKTRLCDFYSYDDLTKQQQKGTEECWRTFFLLHSEEEKDSCKSWNENIDSSFLKVLSNIQTKYN